MIRHIVMWNLHEQAEGADKATNLAKAADAPRGFANALIEQAVA